MVPAGVEPAVWRALSPAERAEFLLHAESLRPADIEPGLWATLTPDEQAEAAKLKEDLEGGETLRDFMLRMAPHHPPPRHFDPVLEELERCRRAPRKVCISMPPRHGKTTLLTNAFAWWLTKNPGDTHAYCSYNNTQAYSKSALARTLTAKAGVELSEDTNNKAEWRTTEGGGLLATGVESGLTGQGVNGLLVIDDPFAGPLDAFSPAQRDHVDDWFRAVPMTRREGASVFVIHTRWHEDDLIGRLKERGGWQIINLPAVAEIDDPLGRSVGEALWPVRFGIDYLTEQRANLGEYDFAALYQGSPRPRGGALFGDPHYYDPATLDLTGCRLVLAGDPAASTKTSADYSAAGVIAVKGHGAERVGYVLKAWRGQVPIPAFANVLLALQAEFGQTAINVEAVGGFKAIPQMLLAIHPDLRINEITPVGDKFTRAQPVAAAWNGGRVLVPADAPPWLGAFLDEIAKFTGVNDKHDDQVDWLAHAWNAPEPARWSGGATGGKTRW